MCLLLKLKQFHMQMRVGIEAILRCKGNVFCECRVGGLGVVDCIPQVCLLIPYETPNLVHFDNHSLDLLTSTLQLIPSTYCILKDWFCPCFFTHILTSLHHHDVG